MKRRMNKGQKLLGLIMLSVGVGMLVGLLFPGIGFIIASLFVVVGFFSWFIY